MSRVSSRYYLRGSVWEASRNEPSRRIKEKTETEKCLVSMLWPVDGIHSFLDVSKETTYNTAFFSDTIMPSLIENIQLWIRKKTLKGWLIHMDRARRYNSGELKSTSKPQEPNACNIRLPAQILP
jgi:hypothetical protein